MGMFHGHNQSSNVPVSGLGYGYLYNWYAASNANFAPTDWKVPTSSEFNTLISYLGGSSIAGGKLKETGLNHWDTPNTGADNSSGFTAYGAGSRTGDVPGIFTNIKQQGIYWGQDETAGSLPYGIYTAYTSAAIYLLTYSYKTQGAPVRLLYTGTGTPTSVTDNDGNVYDVVLIGTQYWTKSNWKCTTLDNGTSIPNVTNATSWAALTTLGRCAYDNDENYV